MPDAPPQDLEAEAAVLGCVLLSPGVLAAMLGPDHGLRSEHFYRETNARLFDCMIGLYEHGEAIDAITLRAAAHRVGVDDARVEELGFDVPAVSSWPSYVKAIKGTYRRRQILEAAYLLAEAGQDDKPALVAEAERLLGEHEANASVYTPERQADDMLGGNLAPVIAPWPWETFNRLTGGGIRAGQTTFLTGWTNHAKSPALDQVLLTAHKAKGLRVALYINEMSQEERAMRFAAQITDAGFEHIRDGDLEPSERVRVANALANDSIPILNVAGWSAEDVCRDITRSGWDVVGVDGLHMFEYDTTAELDHMAVAFAQCAKRTGAHIIVVGHLNEKRAETGVLPPPVLRDIRGSGHVKNVMDFVVMVYRDQTEDGFPLPQGRLYVAKGRNSQLGGMPARYDGDHMRWDAA
jgi:replicative DNA helicase